MGFEPYGVVVKSAAPGAGNEVSITLSYDTYLNVLRIPLTTSATAGNRSVSVVFTVGSDVVLNVYASTAVPASTSAVLHFGDGLPFSAVGDVQYAPVSSGLLLPRGTVITTSTSGLDAADAFGAVTLYGKKSG
jgi:hypothetical protein